jgi:hypothetical protein
MKLGMQVPACALESSLLGDTLTYARPTEARRQYRFNVYEITSIGDDHMIVTGGSDTELVVPKHAIRLITRKLSGK